MPTKRVHSISRSIAMEYYAHRPMIMLLLEFLENSIDGYLELCKDLSHEFMNYFHVSKKHKNYLD